MTEGKQYIIFTDKCLNHNHVMFNLIMKENDNQLTKWGLQKHNLFEWLNYTTEELGELAKAISEYTYRQGSKDNIIKEAIQTATLSIKIAEMVKYHSE